MKYVSGAEIFQSEKTISVRAEECLKGEPALESEMERLITENVCLQKALAEEYVLREDAMRRDESLLPEFFSLNCQFFTGAFAEKEQLFNILKRVYETIYRIRNEKGEIIGYHTTDTSPAALNLIKNLYDRGMLNKYIVHFMSLKGQNILRPYAISARLEKKDPADGKTQEVLDMDFYDQIESSIKNAGFGVFISNRLTAQELEQDVYIQALIESGHDVYIYASEDEDFLRIVVK